MRAAVEATFRRHAGFHRATFTSTAGFGGATFIGDAGFGEAIFDGAAEFSGTTFTGDAWFGEAIFTQHAAFDRADFTGGARFDGATFDQRAVFGETRFTREAVFGGATFDQHVGFRRAIFIGDAGFGGISLSSEELLFRSVHATKRLWLAPRDGNVGEVDLAEVSFTGPAVLATSPGHADNRRPKLTSLEQTDTANLVVAGLDLSDCRFLGAINLDRLRIDGSLLLRWAPGWWRARRQVLYEEGALRDWPGWEIPDRQDGPEASRLQTVYRELRKGREDAKDEPGAADFYYGEQEMRRQAARGVERWLLFGYWLTSGYGLRASRAVAAFLIVVAAFAGLLYGWGFQSTSPSRITGVNMNSGAVTYAAAPPRPDLAAAFAYSAESATVFFRGSSPEQLTEWGRAFQVCLRLLGPTLLGLAVLAVRGRVKR